MEGYCKVAKKFLERVSAHTRRVVYFQSTISIVQICRHDRSHLDIPIYGDAIEDDALDLNFMSKIT